MLVQNLFLTAINFVANFTNVTIPPNLSAKGPTNPPTPSTTGQPHPPRPPPTMAWRCTGRTNAELVSNLFDASIITSPRVRAAMSAVDRAHFCPSPSFAYEDSPQA